MLLLMLVFIFFCNDTATTEIYTLSLHDALPILEIIERDSVVGDASGNLTVVFKDTTINAAPAQTPIQVLDTIVAFGPADRKSTRLNSSHANISYAVFCLKKKQIIIG